MIIIKPIIAPENFLWLLLFRFVLIKVQKLYYLSPVTHIIMVEYISVHFKLN